MCIRDRIKIAHISKYLSQNASRQEELSLIHILIPQNKGGEVAAILVAAILLFFFILLRFVIGKNKKM